MMKSGIMLAFLPVRLQELPQARAEPLQQLVGLVR